MLSTISEHFKRIQDNADDTHHERLSDLLEEYLELNAFVQNIHVIDAKLDQPAGYSTEVDDYWFIGLSKECSDELLPFLVSHELHHLLKEPLIKYGF